MMLSVDLQPAEGIGFSPVYFVRHPIAGRVDSELTVGEVCEFNLLKYPMKKCNNFQIDDGVLANLGNKVGSFVLAAMSGRKNGG